MDKLAPEIRRKNMQAIKSKNTSIELKLGKALWSSGVRYRKNNKKVFGTPDFTIQKYKIAIFCDSEFWHGKDWECHRTDIKTNSDFWIKKIERNISRDLQVNAELKALGWTVLRFWGKRIVKDIDGCLKEILEAINMSKLEC